ncbi:MULTISPECIES: hypothetical protein [Photorhabdus]|uniref:Uncharacterized protein n=1 Tax=Photorhabdus aegyptia TaxID=2805098 RepID=A0A022PCD5_9GAMM|nr:MULTISPECIES: hypothetical protein [Photorhabdus]EYU13194.1 hypothetical protein BA1DRAFT_04329 [Photorhabdus aegyptia]NRN30000.1 hypothetical protein [Photorhabdus heterorhabditis subsp. aluminescens]
MSFKSTIEKIDDSLKKLPQQADNFSALMSKLASYTVVNGLIYFFATRVSCKYSTHEAAIGGILSIIITLLFAIFFFDACANHLPLKTVSTKSKSIFIRLSLYIICVIVGMLLSWLYIAAIYLPLINIPSYPLICQI